MIFGLGSSGKSYRVREDTIKTVLTRVREDHTRAKDKLSDTLQEFMAAHEQARARENGEENN